MKAVADPGFPEEGGVHLLLGIKLQCGHRDTVPKHLPLTAVAQVRSLGWYVEKLSPLLSLRMSGGFPLGFLPPPERFKILSYKPVRVGRVLDLHSGDVKHTFIDLFFTFR